MDALLSTLDRIATDPVNHDLLEILKGVRNGAVYGAKVRFSHALVMTFLFRSGSPSEKLRIILRATREHARNLATFVFIYKSTLYVLKRAANGKDRDIHALFAGLVGGYYVFGRGGRSSVNQQIVLYVFSRVVLGLAKLAVKTHTLPAALQGPAGTKAREAVWSAFAALSWGVVMYLFRTDADVLQPSMRSSMDYIYLDSNRWTSLRTLLWHNK
ncbi:Tim17/Tim22/Tim23/Pmp24 family-domain-containing protein [Limtongia smithiae]|uniref:Tim17/Tim22/Tim23/Pmp24 family-domain-containing protein n=1 Tax=Limtongia smithiae TaxID=1125753 RepID=UPI0034CE17EA